MKRFLTALQFLTIIPVPGNRDPDDEALGASMSFFPLVGLLIGLILVGVRYLLSLLLPPFLADILVIATLVVLTGALHLDGFADTIDGLAGGKDRERTLAIMKDSRIGSFAVVALVLIVGLKAAALAETPEAVKNQALMAFPVLGRWSAVQLAAWFNYARSGYGTGQAFVRCTGRREAAISTLITAVIMVIIFGIPGLTTLLVIAVFTALLGLFFRTRLGGVTGDIMGAACEMSETVVLLVVCGLFV